MKDPYEVLNMPEDSQFDALESRYNELRSQYGEERFLPGEQGAEGARKLTELEDAWRVISEKKKEQDEIEKYGTGYSSVEQLVKDKKYDEAQARLDAMGYRDAEWHYYQALVFYKREWMSDCYSQLKEAARLDPENVKYKDALAKMTQKMANAQTPPEQLGEQRQGMQGNAAGNCLSSCCQMLCCMECLTLPFRCCG